MAPQWIRIQTHPQLSPIPFEPAKSKLREALRKKKPRNSLCFTTIEPRHFTLSKTVERAQTSRLSHCTRFDEVLNTHGFGST
jgi:hypothetical protein